MEVWEVTAAIEGYKLRLEEQNAIVRNNVFAAARYNAANTAFSQKQARSINRQRFEWERKAKRKAVQSFSEITKILKAISKPPDGDK